MAQVPGDFITAEGETMVYCPYNAAHVVTNARLITHLDKCRKAFLKEMQKQNVKVEYRDCKFNYLHKIPLPEIRHHEERCPDQFHLVETIRYHNGEFKIKREEEDRRKEEEDLECENEEKLRKKLVKDHAKIHRNHGKSSSGGTVSGANTVNIKSEKGWGSDTEDWEKESQGYNPGYNPENKLKKGIVLYHPRGLTKSERKNFRKEQRQKANNVESGSLEMDEEDWETSNQDESEKNEQKPSVNIKSEPVEEGQIDEDPNPSVPPSHPSEPSPVTSSGVVIKTEPVDTVPSPPPPHPVTVKSETNSQMEEGETLSPPPVSESDGSLGEPESDEYYGEDPFSEP